MAGDVACRVRPIQAGKTLEERGAVVGGSGRFTGDQGKDVGKRGSEIGRECDG